MLRSALSVGGLDPSGGAGIAADLRGFAAADVWGASACAALTVQSTRGLSLVRAVPSALVEAQMRAALGDLRVGAVKVGALGSAANARRVRIVLRDYPRVAVVIDPVMLPSRSHGDASARLDGRGALSALAALCAAATVVTPNLDEAAALVGAPITSAAEAEQAAIALVARGARAALVKGGHARANNTKNEVVDWLATASRVVRIARPRLAVGAVHGTGCTLAALIAGRLAAQGARHDAPDEALIDAVVWARDRFERALRSPLRVGHGQRVLRVAS